MDLRALMEQAFKYRIGEMVIARNELTALKLDLDVNQVGDHFLSRYDKLKVLTGSVVVERMLQECHGGVQLHYRVKHYTDKGEILATLAELELASYEEYATLLKSIAAKRPQDPKPDPMAPPIKSTRMELAELREAIEKLTAIVQPPK